MNAVEIIRHYVLRGPNYYSRRPLIKLILDPVDNIRLDNNVDFEAIRAGLLKDIPSLMEHRCNPGKTGGFISEVENGTSLAHIVEHLAIEFQYLIGHSVSFGRTISLGASNLFMIVYEYETEEVGVEAGYQSVEYLRQIMEQNPLSVKQICDSLSSLKSQYEPGPSTNALIKEAREQNIPVLRLNNESLYQLGYGQQAKRIKASITSQTSCIAVDIASDKGLLNDLLVGAGIPVPYGIRVGSVGQALDAFMDLKKPVIVKPNTLNHGKGVTLDIDSESKLVYACDRALGLDRNIILQEQVSGDDYRLLIVDGAMVAAAKRMPPEVVGDGKSTIKDLIIEINKQEVRGEGHEKPLTKIDVDRHLEDVLYEQGVNLDSILVPNQRVRLRSNANLSSGGTAEDVTKLVHPDIKKLAETAAKLVGLDLAGVDIIAQDIAKDPISGEVYVIEINASPGLRMHLAPSKGEPKNVAEPIIKYMFPEPAASRIPIISVTGTNGKTTTVRLIANILKAADKIVGLTSTDGIEIAGKNLTHSDDAGPGGARVVLTHPAVEVAVLETARGGILRSGLGYDWCDIGIVTNVSDDHVNQDGVYSTRDIADVKSVVLESVKASGWAIINADDAYAEFFTGRCGSKLAYYSLQKDNPILASRVDGVVAFIDNGEIVICDYDKNNTISIAPIQESPITMGGVVDFNVANCLAASLGTYLTGVDPSAIPAGLLSFKENTGRMNFFQMNGMSFVIDYAHNCDAITMLINNVRKLCAGGKIIGVFTAPGDRCDETLTNLGKAMSEVDYLVLREDKDLRGRQPGEVSELLKAGAGGEAKAEVFPDEDNAIEHALEVANPGDWVLINYEKLQYVYEALSKALLKLGWEQVGAEFTESKPGLKVMQLGETGKSTILNRSELIKQIMQYQGRQAELEDSDCLQYCAEES